MKLIERWFRKNPYPQMDRVIQDYRSTLTSETALKVLTHRLNQLCFFREIENEEDRLLHNEALNLLRCYGIWDGFEDRSLEIVRALVSLPQNVYEPKEEL